MNLTNRHIDHIVYAVPNLEKAIDDLEKELGVRPTFGGYHTTQGTKNAVLNLGNQCYLEILAADEENTNISPPRWMGIDLIQASKITRWAIKSANLAQDSIFLSQYQSDMGKIKGGQRKLSNGGQLTWKMIMPLASPEVEISPFMVDWQDSELHPTQQMEQHCELIGLEFTHPEPNSLSKVLDQLFLDLDVVKGDKISIMAKIKCPNGIVIL